eukprot:CAMPEP_0168748004 /NCGR_PEP_ID=MMETSP0724-20121128/15951_1 /TAXON_ID=265536 /ORGANISM="Amphiprora sp., Strain CCMP467" /LENGTH=494 /DNA_ID=CAMNT_0008795817 /DNA_START=154 /DNA_END=1635 /DNA_ORIENTATION=+
MRTPSSGSLVTTIRRNLDSTFWHRKNEPRLVTVKDLQLLPPVPRLSVTHNNNNHPTTTCRTRTRFDSWTGSSAATRLAAAVAAASAATAGFGWWFDNKAENENPPSHKRVQRGQHLPYLSSSSSSSSPFHVNNSINTTLCDDDNNGGLLLYTEKDFPDGYTESDRFIEVLRFHRSLLPDYIDRWIINNNNHPTKTMSWPTNVPSAQDIHSLQMDFHFCQRSPNYRNMTQTCQDLQFRIACYWLSTATSPENQQKGFHLIKDLAERGHADGMCYYGILLNQGTIPGVEAQPEQAVVWWRRAVDYHRHIWACYELGVAFYTGEGVPENAPLASRFFRRAAHFGHAGAAYVLGDLLLNGNIRRRRSGSGDSGDSGSANDDGIPRDRATALEWLVTAAELGHPLAQERVIIVIQQDSAAYEDTNGQGLWPETKEETLKWTSHPDSPQARQVLIERRYTIGGGTRNPIVMKRRKTVVEESVQGSSSSSSSSSNRAEEEE